MNKSDDIRHLSHLPPAGSHDESQSHKSTMSAIGIHIYLIV